MASLGRSLSNIDQRSAERASARSKIRAVPRTSPQSHHVQQRQIRPQYPSRGTVSQRKYENERNKEQWIYLSKF